MNDYMHDIETYKIFRMYFDLVFFSIEKLRMDLIISISYQIKYNKMKRSMNLEIVSVLHI
jgi:hypothetical protein